MPARTSLRERLRDRAFPISSMALDRCVGARSRHKACARRRAVPSAPWPAHHLRLARPAPPECSQAGIRDLHPLMFRHTFAHAWLNGGGDETDPMRMRPRRCSPTTAAQASTMWTASAPPVLMWPIRLRHRPPAACRRHAGPRRSRGSRWCPAAAPTGRAGPGAADGVTSKKRSPGTTSASWPEPKQAWTPTTASAPVNDGVCTSRTVTSSARVNGGLGSVLATCGCWGLEMSTTWTPSPPWAPWPQRLPT